MSEDRPTQRMHELLQRIDQALNELEAGKLDLDRLDAACTDAQQLYERLVVLRHKAREAKRAPVAAPANPEVAPEVAMPSLRLDTRPAEAPIRQTSLIDAIAETEEPPPAKPEPPAPKAPEPTPPAKPTKPVPPPSEPKAPSLAERTEQGPVGDLHKAIALSQKFWFVAELFAGQRDRYEKAIDSLNGMKQAEEARRFITAEIVGKASKPPAEDALRAFNELVERRFK